MQAVFISWKLTLISVSRTGFHISRLALVKRGRIFRIHREPKRSLTTWL